MTARLDDIQVLILDCQTTGSHPDKGHLLEVGWTVAGAGPVAGGRDLRATSHVLELPGLSEIPRPVERLTGISSDDLKQASKPSNVWVTLAATARKVAFHDRLSGCPTVIHFARFETPFLKWFHTKYGQKTPFPLDIICSHEISRRLLPGLPRKGLRAVAGYFGHSVPAAKRSAAHVIATAVIWKHLVELLHMELKIDSLEELKSWLVSTRPTASTERLFPMPREIRLAVPDTSGIYRMQRSNGDLLYIGKAKSLKQRVNSYFRKSSHHSERILEMLSQAADLKVTLTGSALEAALLESGEIKRHRPPYNLALQERGRRLWFCSRDFRHFSETPDKLHRVGPLPSNRTCLALRAIGTVIRSGLTVLSTDGDISAATLLDIPPEYAPGDDCLREGLAIFIRRNRNKITKKDVWRSLITIGTLVWRERLQAQENGSDCGLGQPEEEKTEDETGGVWIWTPDSVANSLESVLRRSTHMIRRARWLTLLSESSLAWDTPAGNENMKNVLVFKAGAIVDRYSCKKGDSLPVPPGCKRKFHERLHNLDLITYDRLRVLTTEMRRLISENRSPSIRLGSSNVLLAGQIRSALKWV